MLKTSDAVLNILQSKLIPWIEKNGLEQIVVAHAQLRQTQRHHNFSFTSQKLIGPREGVRSFTFGMTSAVWPNDHLVEKSSSLLLFILNGKADLRLGDYWLHATEGQGVFILPNVPRKDGTQPYLHPKNRETGQCSTINFAELRGRLYIWLNRSQGEIHEVAKQVKPIHTLDDRALQLLKQLQYHFQSTDPIDTFLCQYLLKSFLLTLKNDLQQGHFLQSGRLHTAHNHNPNTHNPIEQAQQYIRTHLHEPLTLQSVAQQIYLSRTQFASRFTRETGQTFNQFVTQCRLEQAKVLLKETDYTLTFISLSVGYRSLTYFHRVFLRYVGQTAQEYRRQEIANSTGNQKEDDNTSIRTKMQV